MELWLDAWQDADEALPSLLGANAARGREAERQIEQSFRQRGYAVVRQMPVVMLGRHGLPEAGRIDLVPLARPGGAAALPAPPPAFEIKHVDLARYRSGSGLDTRRLQGLVGRHVQEALWYQEGLRGLNCMRRQRGLAPLTERVGLFYVVPRATSRAEASVFQTLAAAVARRRGVKATVLMPGSPASRL